MRILSSTALLLFVFLLLSSCARDYARFQRTPPVSYRQPTPPKAVSDPKEEEPAPSLPDDLPAVDLINIEITEASTSGRVPVSSPSQRTRQPIERITRMASSETETTTNLPQPRPRPKAQQDKKTLREILGLKPRPKLNWWQRIPWQLKASIIVIAVALLFAFLKITLMAVIFGLIGAYLLVQGLKKSFKVRRPWF
ncbi:hypothetical protein GCM10023189_17090 [Nibrella saemangeumensis]|uniref:Uncharacterized protein n=1 Tax=Nibrella saemangeumensis TaxID=1084526 RepID=A0ABP8MM31_9BACT